MIVNDKRIDILTKIEKLMAHTQTESGAVNVNEMAIANKLVKELMDKYEISIDEIKATSDKSIIQIESEVKTINKWQIELASLVSTFYECRVMKSGIRLFFIGFNTDANDAMTTFNSLYAQISQRALDETVEKTEISRKTRIIDFAIGTIHSIGVRLNEIIQEKELHMSKEALIIIKKDVIEKGLHRMYSNSSPIRNNMKFSKSEDYLKGVEYGKCVEIHKKL
jgi:hypothetical protein